MGDGLTLVATEASARQGKASWILRYRFGGRQHEQVLRRHIKPVIGKLPVEEVRPIHIDRVLTMIVDGGAPTVANDALRYGTGPLR